MAKPDWRQSRALYIVGHACAAGLFVFSLQVFALKQTLEWSALWGAGFAIAAAMLAWKQTTR